MARKRALVVDDSKSARLILRKMLEKQGLDVDTAGSAEEALDYLRHQHPHVIFMDHMMPGMDGFQAVKTIKADPRTATIPIMMYTSKEGEVYVGEARALGAVGVVPKEVKPADLLKVLEALHLLPEPGEAAPARRPAREPQPEAADALLVPGQKISSLAREAAEDAIWQFLRASLDEMRIQLRKDIHDELETARQSVENPETQEAARPRRRRGLWLAAAVVVLAVGAGLWAWQTRPPQGPATPMAANDAARGGLTKENATLLKSLAAQRTQRERERAQFLKTVEWALNQSGQYEFGTPPFGEERLAMLSELLNRLNAVGFEGTVRLSSHVGQFCLVRDNAGELRMAPPDLPLSRCDSMGLGQEQAVAAASRQSLAFANFLGASPVVHKGKITIQLDPHGDEAPRYEHPPASAVGTAGQWNAIARRNNRVEFSLIPSS